MRFFLVLFFVAAFAPSLASAASDVNLEITNRTKDTLLMTSVSSKCMEIPYRTQLPPNKLSKIHIEWNSHGSCKIQDTYTELEFTDPRLQRTAGTAKLISSRDRFVPVAGPWYLTTTAKHPYCLPKNGYDQILITQCM